MQRNSTHVPSKLPFPPRSVTSDIIYNIVLPVTVTLQPTPSVDHILIETRSNDDASIEGRRKCCLIARISGNTTVQY